MADSDQGRGASREGGCEYARRWCTRLRQEHRLARQLNGRSQGNRRGSGQSCRLSRNPAERTHGAARSAMISWLIGPATRLPWGVADCRRRDNGRQLHLQEDIWRNDCSKANPHGQSQDSQETWKTHPISQPPEKRIPHRNSLVNDMIPASGVPRTHNFTEHSRDPHGGAASFASTISGACSASPSSPARLAWRGASPGTGKDRPSQPAPPG